MNIIEERDSAENYVRLWTLDEVPNAVFATHIVGEGATRYQFSVKTETKECELVDAAGITPPRTVIQVLNDNGYTLQNVPNLTDEKPAKTAKQVGESIVWLEEHGGFEPDDLRAVIYHRVSNTIPVIYSALLFEEFIPEDELETRIGSFLNTYTGGDISLDESHVSLSPEQLQQLLLNFNQTLSERESSELVRLSEEVLGITEPTGERQRELNEQLERGKASEPLETGMSISEEAFEILREEGWLE